jgi:hypothetical protein
VPCRGLTGPCFPEGDPLAFSHCTGAVAFAVATRSDTFPVCLCHVRVPFITTIKLPDEHPVPAGDLIMMIRQ